MFPSFRIVSGGPLSGMNSFISNESLYASGNAAMQTLVVPLPASEQGVNSPMQDFGFPEVPLPEESGGE